MAQVFDVAIIGGGAAATTALMALSAQGNRPPKVLWVAPAADDGRGVAYSTREPMHRLNVRALRMSARADRPGDFVDFLIARDGHADPQAFYPRRWYGDYLAQGATDAWSKLPGERWQVLASGVRRDGDHWIVRGNDGGQRRARHLLMAIGPQAQIAPASVDPQLQGSGLYRIDPYAWANTPPRGSKAGEIWILGSGLTAIDLVLSAAQRHSNAQIHLISRHGGLPGVHATAHEAVPDPFGSATLLPNASVAMHMFRRAATACGDWRAQVESLRAQSATRWQHWPESEQRRFLRHLRWAWDCARHRMAPEVASAIQALIANGRVQVHRGNLLAITAQQGRALVQWRGRGENAINCAPADLVLQATGLNTRVSSSVDPLLRSLLDQGLARPDALDLGLAVDAEQRLIAADGKVRADAHVLGALARGSRYECLAMPEIRATAAHIAGAIAALDWAVA